MATTANQTSLRSKARRAFHGLVRLLPASAQERTLVAARRWTRRFPIFLVRFGSLRRVRPISKNPAGRGTAIDRYYIDAFIGRHATDIYGRVLECLGRDYTVRFGGPKVLVSDVLNVEADNPNSTFVGDLAGVNDLPSESFDCVVLTQVLHLIYDIDAAVATVKRVLKPGGVVLATMPGITPVHFDRWPWMWSLTTESARRLFERHFPSHHVEVEGHGNVFAAIAFLHGISLEEIDKKKLDPRDKAYAVTVAVRAVKG